jgi:alcohol dehydrogenase
MDRDLKIMDQRATILLSKAQLLAVKALTLAIPVSHPLVFAGENSSMQLCGNIAQLGMKKALIVTDAVLVKLGVIQPIVDELNQKGLDVVIFSEVKPDPTCEIVENSLAVFKANQCDCVLGIGGGSTIDTAKVLALAAANNKTPKQLFGILKSRKPAYPLFVIPTTAGTGSEVTIAAVISDSQTHIKGLVIDPKVVPLATALDPIIMKGMPPAITADTGIDALTHAIESWVSGFANKQSDYYASAAMKLILNHLKTAYEDGQNIAAREAMALGSHYAGLAMNSAGIGYVHALAHQLGTQYQIAHGRANAIVLPHVLEFNRKASEKRLALAARKIGLCNQNTSDEQAAGIFIQSVKQLLKDLEIKTEIPNLKKQDFPAMIKSAFSEAHGIYAVPRYMNYADAERILNML